MLLAREGEHRRGGRAAHVRASAYPGFPPYYFITAKPELERLEAELSPEELAAAREAAEAADLESVVAAAEHVLGGALSGRPS